MIVKTTKPCLNHDVNNLRAAVRFNHTRNRDDDDNNKQARTHFSVD
jgi:hypothetical protein